MKRKIDRLNSLIAFGLCLMLAASVLMTAAATRAAENAAVGKCGYEPYAEGNYGIEHAPEGNYAGVAYNKGEEKTPFAKLTKSAKYNEGSFNEFDITITVEGDKIDPPPKPVFTVLVLDMSSSMEYNMAGQSIGKNNAGPSRLSLLQEAVSSFMESYFTNEGTANWLSIVTYNRSYATVLDWTDVNKTFSYPKVESYTNIEAGICGAIAQLDKVIKAERPGAYGIVAADACEYAVVVMSDGGANMHTGSNTTGANDWTWDKALSYQNPTLSASTSGSSSIHRANSAVNAANALASGPLGSYSVIKPKVFSVLYGENGATDGGSKLSASQISSTMKSIGRNGSFESGADGQVAHLIFSNIQRMIDSPSIEEGAVVRDVIPGDFTIKSVTGRIGSGNCESISPVKNADGDYDIVWVISSPIGAGNAATLTITVDVPPFCMVDELDVPHSDDSNAYRDNTCESAMHHSHYVRDTSPNGKRATLIYTNVTNNTGKAWEIDVGTPRIHAPANEPQLAITNVLSREVSVISDGGFATFAFTVSNAAGSNKAYGLTLDATCAALGEAVEMTYIGAKDNEAYEDPRIHPFDLDAGDSIVFYFQIPLSNDMTEAFAADYDRLKEAEEQAEESLAIAGDNLISAAIALAADPNSGFIYDGDTDIAALISALMDWIANPQLIMPEPPPEAEEETEEEAGGELEGEQSVVTDDTQEASNESGDLIQGEYGESGNGVASDEGDALGTGDNTDATDAGVGESGISADEQSLQGSGVEVEVLSAYIPLSAVRLLEPDDVEPQEDTGGGEHQGEGNESQGDAGAPDGTDSSMNEPNDIDNTEAYDPYAAQREQLLLIMNAYSEALNKRDSAAQEFEDFKANADYPDVKYSSTVTLKKGTRVLGQATDTLDVPPNYGTVKIDKHVSLDGSSWQKSVTLPIEGGTANYRIIISNYSEKAADIAFSDTMYNGGQNEFSLAPRGDVGSMVTIDYSAHFDGQSGSFSNIATVILEDGSSLEAAAMVIVPAKPTPTPDQQTVTTAPPSDSLNTPTNTATATPQNTSTTAPTAPPKDASTTTPTATPKDASTTTPTATPKETATPTPSAPLITVSSTPTATPKVTPTSTPVLNAVQTATPEATRTTEPTKEPTKESSSESMTETDNEALPTIESDETNVLENATASEETQEADETNITEETQASEGAEETEEVEETGEDEGNEEAEAQAAPISANFITLSIEEIPEGIQPASESSTFVQREDGGSIIELDDEGVPLGRWYQDDDGVWIFDEEIPLDELPTTGELSLPMLLFFAGAMISSGGAYSKHAYAKRRSFKLDI